MKVSSRKNKMRGQALKPSDTISWYDVTNDAWRDSQSLQNGTK